MQGRVVPGRAGVCENLFVKLYDSCGVVSNTLSHVPCFWIRAAMGHFRLCELLIVGERVNVMIPVK